MIKICKFKNGKVALKQKKNLKSNSLKRIKRKMMRRFKVLRKYKRIRKLGKNFSQTSHKNVRAAWIRKI